jgi:hypothetical protein
MHHSSDLVGVQQEGFGDGQAGYLFRPDDAPMMYMIQIDCDNDVIITEGDAAR